MQILFNRARARDCPRSVHAHMLARPRWMWTMVRSGPRTATACAAGNQPAPGHPPGPSVISPPMSESLAFASQFSNKCRNVAGGMVRDGYCLSIVVDRPIQYIICTKNSYDQTSLVNNARVY